MLRVTSASQGLLGLPCATEGTTSPPWARMPASHVHQAFTAYIPAPARPDSAQHMPIAQLGRGLHHSVLQGPSLSRMHQVSGKRVTVPSVPRVTTAGAVTEVPCRPSSYCGPQTGVPPLCPGGCACPASSSTYSGPGQRCVFPHYCPPGSTQPRACPGGSEALNGSGLRVSEEMGCRLCEVGTYQSWVLDALPCQPCPPGFSCSQGESQRGLGRSRGTGPGGDSEWSSVRWVEAQAGRDPKGLGTPGVCRRRGLEQSKSQTQEHGEDGDTEQVCQLPPCQV
ncbi:uncharacterized protein LOC135272738 isoform X2 [Aotus nancymaae]|uniref:uncharacterized protein LOC135272738 isoform X2 n=1 Tax=Aotus nancymaae TaxID=37293 RepID=UPI0030FF36BF